MSTPEGLSLEYDDAAPPLPVKLRSHVKLARSFLKPGAYFAWIEPFIAGHDPVTPNHVLAGILRVRHHHRRRHSLSASGDLYACSREDVQELKEKLGRTTREDYRLRGLQLPRERYQYYLRSVDLAPFDLETEGEDPPPGGDPPQGLRFCLETHYWGGEEKGWEKREIISLELDAPVETDGALKAAIDQARLRPVLNDAGTQIGSIGLVKIADRLRHAKIRVLDMASERTFDPGRDPHPPFWDVELWREALGQADWSLDLERLVLDAAAQRRAAEYPRPADGKWTRAQLNGFHDAVIEDAIPRDQQEWIYHFLVVDNIVLGDTGNPSGLLYDVGGRSPEDLARQGAAVAATRASSWTRDQALRNYPRLFHRVALHELGHMQGLYHNERGRGQGLMQPHSELPEGAEIRLRHYPIDAQRLRHLPDHWVRPGGVPFGYRYRETALDVLTLFPESPGLELELRIEPSPEIALRRADGDGRREGGPEAIVLRLANRRQQREVETATFYPYDGKRLFQDLPPAPAPSATEADILCPNELQVQPRYRRLGAFLREPSGLRREIWPVRTPRALGRGGTTLFGSRAGDGSGGPADEGETIEYRVPWTEDAELPPLLQPGVHELEVHLSWAVENGEAFRVSASVELHAFHETTEPEPRRP